MQQITSVNNLKVKEIAKLLQKKYRDDSKTFLIEGFKGVEDALTSNLEILSIFTLSKYIDKFVNYKDIEVYEVNEAILKKMSDTKNSPSVVAVVKQPEQSLPNVLNKVLLLENIKDVGNLGTIIRTSTAFNIDAIILYGETVDLYNPKCVRATVGNLWKLPIIHTNDFFYLEKTFKDFDRVGTLPLSDNSTLLSDFEFANKTLMMFGSEADGLSEQLRNFATRNITIEMSEKVESLNLGISVGVILYRMSIA